MRNLFSADFTGQSAIGSVLGYPPEAGAGTGGAAGQSGIGGTVGAVDRGTGGGGAGSGGGTPYKLTDDSLVDLGDGKGVKWSEARGSRYVGKDEHEKLSQTFSNSRGLLMEQAKKIDEAWAQVNAARQQLNQGGGNRQPQIDIAEEIAGLPIVDGASAAKAIKALRDQGLAPIAQLVTQQQASIKALMEEVKGIRGTAGTLAEHHQTKEFDSHVTTALGKVGEIKGLSQPLPSDNPVVRAIASDLWLSYDPKTWKMDDYHRMLNERISGLVALVLDDQKKAIETAKTKKRTFFGQGGKVQPNGAQGYKHMSGRDIARESGIFSQSANT